MSKPLDQTGIEKALGSLPGWTFAENKLTKTFSFSSFREAMSFLIRVAFEAEDLNHHPEIQNVYNRVGISLTTHDAGDRVTDRDVALAERIEGFSWV